MPTDISSLKESLARIGQKAISAPPLIILGTLGGFTDVLPVLDAGEVLVVGDASLLPSRIRIAEPKSKPDSGTISFWDRWCEDKRFKPLRRPYIRGDVRAVSSAKCCVAKATS
jgi:hypothetical protein